MAQRKCHTDKHYPTIIVHARQEMNFTELTNLCDIKYSHHLIWQNKPLAHNFDFFMNDVATLGLLLPVSLGQIEGYNYPSGHAHNNLLKHIYSCDYL